MVAVLPAMPMKRLKQGGAPGAMLGAEQEQEAGYVSGVTEQLGATGVVCDPSDRRTEKPKEEHRSSLPQSAL